MLFRRGIFKESVGSLFGIFGKAIWITISFSLSSFDLKGTFRSISSRMLYFAIFAFILVIQWAYKGRITAELTVVAKYPPINSLAVLLTSSGLDWGVRDR